MTEPCTGCLALGGASTRGARHLSYHLWPTHHSDAWKWNLDQLADRWELFDGLRVLGLNQDRNSVGLQEVIDHSNRNGMIWDQVLSRRNVPSLGEVRTWEPRLRWILDRAHTDDVIFCAHGKGVKYPGNPLPEVIRLWTETAYHICCDDWPAVEHQLQRFPITGPFKKYTGFPGLWHYSGTFFWVRVADVRTRNWALIDRAYPGVEMWPGRHFSPSEGGCLFLDNCGELYIQQYWDDVVLPALHSRPHISRTAPTI